MKSSKVMTHNEWIGLVLGGGLLFGTILRFTPGLLAGFPVYDGGMFLRMIQDLKTSHYALPVTTSYNLLDLPDAYPSLGFYLARYLSDVFQVPEIALLRFLPAIFSVAGIIAFYLVAKTILKDNVRAALASALLAVTPGGYFWYIMWGD